MSGMAWDKFFWSDYDADEGLRMCSLAAQGLWMRMLCLMARATPKGELRVGSLPCTNADLSRVTGELEVTVAGLVGELEVRGVFSRTRAGVIYSRRLRYDAELSKKRAKAGAKGAAATNLRFKQNPELPQQNGSKPPGKRAAPEARSQSSDTNVSAVKPPDPVKVLFDLGVSVLTAAGIDEERARSLVGRWKKAHGDGETMAALLDAQRLGITAPIEWLEKRFVKKTTEQDAYLEHLDRKYAAGGHA